MPNVMALIKTEVVLMLKEIKLWGRVFNLEVIFDCYNGEKVLPIQEEALNNITTANAELEKALESIKEYCLKYTSNEINPEHIDNIFKYVIPYSIFVKRNEEKRIVGILCKFKFDPEHGIAISFENEKFSKVGFQDIVL